MAMLQQLWQRFIEPSPQITEPDQRRQASLLSSVLLVTIVLAVIVEAITIEFIGWEHYTGYRTTIRAVILFLVIYVISRTKHLRLASLLSVIVASTAIFISGL